MKGSVASKAEKGPVELRSYVD